MTQDCLANLHRDLTQAEIAAARTRLSGQAYNTPLVRSAGGFHLKLENLQPFGSYKIRGAMNYLLARKEEGRLGSRIISASAGNFGQALTAGARTLGIPITIHVPDKAAEVKVAALRRLGADVVLHDFADWWRIMETRSTEGAEGLFVHPVCEREVMIGAATLGAEIVEQLPDVAEIVAPLGGGGLAVGIAQAVKLMRPACKVYVVESEAAMPYRAALDAGEPVAVVKVPSFIDGMGSTRILDAMWPLLRRWIDDSITVSVESVGDAVRTLALDHHVIAEGAGAAAFAACTQGRKGQPQQVAILSGGNIDPAVLCDLLAPPAHG